ncbi:WAT1-related protein [Sesamum alatum]|uniref:WAT1-related protein n=1 Tax=Sesamum alatum TaxID=300844 RepID=A0AAE2CPL9_9LAMI|nr:WAT1-related protein [Sesamum alatum]
MGMQKHMPLIAMLFAQFIYAAMFMLSKAAISSGIKPSVFVVYRQALAALVLAPFAYFFERKKSPPLTWSLACKIFIVATLGLTMTQNLHYIGLNYVSATFATAVSNTVPVMVFIIAVLLRIEKVGLSERHGWGKVVGTAVGLCGAMIYTFYKGPPLDLHHSHRNEAPAPAASFSKTHTKQEWIKGSLIMIASNLTWALWLIMQNPILKSYPARLRLTTLQCGFCCLTTAIYGAIVERNIESWKLGWNLNLFAIAYCGIVVTGISYTLLVWVVEKRGPVFPAIFSPLPLLITAIFSAIFFHETLRLGSVLGGVLLVGGLGSNIKIEICEKSINKFYDTDLDPVPAGKRPNPPTDGAQNKDLVSPSA